LRLHGNGTLINVIDGDFDIQIDVELVDAFSSLPRLLIYVRCAGS